jgi:hypothetical protein
MKEKATKENESARLPFASTVWFNNEVSETRIDHHLLSWTVKKSKLESGMDFYDLATSIASSKYWRRAMQFSLLQI